MLEYEAIELKLYGLLHIEFLSDESLLTCLCSHDLLMMFIKILLQYIAIEQLLINSGLAYTAPGF